MNHDVAGAPKNACALGGSVHIKLNNILIKLFLRCVTGHGTHDCYSNYIIMFVV